MERSKLKVYEGGKGGSSNPRTPVEQDDSAQSIARCRMLLALGEGEFAGGLDATKIYLDSTPLANADGSYNFDNVVWEFRPGVQMQDPINGFPAVENESTIGVDLKVSSPFVRAINNTQIDAVLIRMGITSLMQQESDGDIVGTSVRYHIDISTDGGAYQRMVDKTVTEKLSDLYEITHRINLPRANTGWQIRIVRDTPDSTSNLLINGTSVRAITEVIDARLRYPHTALLYVSFNAKSFSNIPKISCLVKGRVIRVPSNYDPVSRQYTGTWDGTFKYAHTNNPAWIWLDVLTEKRFGLGRRVTVQMLDKWELYKISQRCDQMVPDGKGGSGTEPRFMFDCYIQRQEDAWSVIKDIAAGFNGMTFWGNNMFQVISDMPADESKRQIVTRASVVDGKINYSSGSEKNRFSSALVNYSDPVNHYQDRTTAAMFPDLIRQFKFRQTTLTAIGCTRESEAQRRASWACYSNYLDRMARFSVGLEGIAYMPGVVFSLADERLSGRIYGGRIVSYNAGARAVEMDRSTSAVAGDRFMVKTSPNEMPESRVIQAVNGNQIILASAFTLAPLPNAVFVIDANQLRLQQFRVTDLQFNEEDSTFTIQAVEYNASKYDAVDNNARLDTPPISLIPTGVVGQPRNVGISSYESIKQGQRITSMVAEWDAPLDANGKVQSDIIGYQMQWKRDDNEWINVPQTGLRRFEINGIYEGDYLVRVRALNNFGASSLWASSSITHLTGRQGEVPAPVGFRVSTDLVFAIQQDWGFGPDTADSAYTEIQYSAFNSADGMQTLSMVPYPQHTFQQTGLRAGVTLFYRARLVDRLGNMSPWTEIEMGQSTFDANAIIDVIDDAIRDSDAFMAISKPIENNIEAILQEALDSDASVTHQMKAAGKNRADIIEVRTTTADALGAFAQQVTQVQAEVNENSAAVEEVFTAQAEINGKLSAGYGVKVQLNAAGRPYIAGMQIGIQSDGQSVQSYALFNADTFAVYNGTGDNNSLPFVIQGGQVFIRDAFIADGAITNAKIGAVIQSVNYVAGTTGWALNKSGYFENNGYEPGNGRMTQNNNQLSVYDGNGVLRVRIGKLS